MTQAAGDDEAFGRLACAVQDDLFRFALARGHVEEALPIGDSLRRRRETHIRGLG
jgi:hypothetical protein